MFHSKQFRERELKTLKKSFFLTIKIPWRNWKNAFFLLGITIWSSTKSSEANPKFSVLLDLRTFTDRKFIPPHIFPRLVFWTSTSWEFTDRKFQRQTRRRTSTQVSISVCWFMIGRMVSMLLCSTRSDLLPTSIRGSLRWTGRVVTAREEKAWGFTSVCVATW